MRRSPRTIIVEVDTPFLSMFVRRDRTCLNARFGFTTAAVALFLFVLTLLAVKRLFFSMAARVVDSTVLSTWPWGPLVLFVVLLVVLGWLVLAMLAREAKQLRFGHHTESSADLNEEDVA